METYRTHTLRRKHRVPWSPGMETEELCITFESWPWSRLFSFGLDVNLSRSRFSAGALAFGYSVHLGRRYREDVYYTTSPSPRP
jgi:hypothetical protein